MFRTTARPWWAWLIAQVFAGVPWVLLTDFPAKPAFLTARPGNHREQGHVTRETTALGD